MQVEFFWKNLCQCCWNTWAHDVYGLACLTLILFVLECWEQLNHAMYDWPNYPLPEMINVERKKEKPTKEKVGQVKPLLLLLSCGARQAWRKVLSHTRKLLQCTMKAHTASPLQHVFNGAGGGSCSHRSCIQCAQLTWWIKLLPRSTFSAAEGVLLYLHPDLLRFWLGSMSFWFDTCWWTGHELNGNTHQPEWETIVMVVI